MRVTAPRSRADAGFDTGLIDSLGVAVTRLATDSRRVQPGDVEVVDRYRRFLRLSKLNAARSLAEVIHAHDCFSEGRHAQERGGAVPPSMAEVTKEQVVDTLEDVAKQLETAQANARR